MSYRKRKLAMCIVLLLVLTITTNASGLVKTNKLNFEINEQVGITINTSGTSYNISDLELSINSPSNYFKYLGLTDNLVFYPQEEGIYSLDMRQGENVIEKIQFSVGNTYANLVSNINDENDNEDYNENNAFNNSDLSARELPEIILLKNNFSIGEIIQINFSQNLTDYALNIQSPSNNFQYLGIPGSSIIFIGQEPGDYLITIFEDTRSISEKGFSIDFRDNILNDLQRQNHSELILNDTELVSNANSLIGNESRIITNMHNNNPVYIERKSDFIKEKRIFDNTVNNENSDYNNENIINNIDNNINNAIYNNNYNSQNDNNAGHEIISYKLGIISNKSFFNLSKWENEIHLEILDDNEVNISKEYIDGASFQTKNYETKIYEIENGIEYEQVFSEKPSSNQIVLGINSENLNFYYQAPLNQGISDPSCTPTDCHNLHRPENIVGSYAVYHKNKKDNFYKTGKAFHIYRPKITDANNHSVWGELNISEGNNTAYGIMTITIPQDFLDNAAYPIIVDPTFGYDTGGQSYSTNPTSAFADLVSTHTATSGEILTTYYVYAGSDTTGATIQMGIYDDDSGRPKGRINSETVTIDKNPDWYSLESLSVELSDSTLYYVAFQDNQDGKNDIYYDDTPGEQSNSECTSGLAEAWSEDQRVEYRYSIYATVESGGGAVDNGPTSSLVSPLDGTLSINTSYQFRCNASDDNKINNVTLRIWNSAGAIFYNFTNTTSSTSNLTYNFTVTNFASGVYNWNCLVFDNNSQSNWSVSNYTLIVDAIPNVSLYSPQNSNISTTGNITFICNISDNFGLKNVSLWTNISGTWQLNQTIIINNYCGQHAVNHHSFNLINNVCNITYAPNEPNSKDTWVDQAQPTTNLGGQEYLQLRQYNTVDGRPLLWFNMTIIPSLAFIETAKLKLYNYDGAGVDNNLNASPYENNAEWNESTITWSIRPNGTMQLAENISLKNSAAMGWINWSFNSNGLSLVRSWVNGTTPNYGMQVYTPYTSGGGPYRRFASSNYTTDTSLRPQFIVTYNSTLNISAEFNITNIQNGNYEWNCLAIDGNGNSAWGASNYSLNVLVNTVPTITKINLTPTSAYTNDTLYCLVNATDSTNANINLTAKWYRDNINFLNQTALNYAQGMNYTFNLSYNNTFHNNIIFCNVSANDGIVTSSWNSSSTVFIQNFSTTLSIGNSTAIQNQQINFTANFSSNNIGEIGDLLWYSGDIGENFFSVEFADLDQSGSLDDLLVAHQIAWNDWGYKALFANNGSHRYNSSRLAVNGVNAFHGLRVFDADNDSFFDDIALSTGNGYLAVYNRTGNITWNTSGLGTINSLDIGDYDGQGYKNDIAIGVINATTNYHHIFVYNSSSGTFWSRYWSSPVFDSSASGTLIDEIISADIDDDNRTDIIAIDEAAGHILVFNGSNGAYIFNSTDLGFSFSVTVGDIDHDGYEDDVIVGGGTDTYVFRFNGTYGATYSTTVYYDYSALPVTYVYEIRSFDYNNDGYKDEYVASDQGAWNGAVATIWMYNNNSDHLWNYTFNRTATGYDQIYNLQVADWNDDRDEEIFFKDEIRDNITVINTSGVITKYISTNQADTGVPNDYGAGIKLGDVNNDTINDLIFILRTGHVFAYQDVNCIVKFNDSTTENMTWNGTRELWLFNKTFNETGSYGYNITCQKGGYALQFLSSTINITQINRAPTHNTPIISPNPAYDNTNITCINQSTSDLDGDSVTNVFNWLKNNISTTVLLMSFDSNISSTSIGAIKDYSSYGNNGTLGNGTGGTEPSWNSTGKFGGSYFFDGTDDRILVNNSLSLHGNNTWTGLTVEAWVNPNSVATARGIVSMRIDAADSSYNMGFDGAGGGNQLFCGFYLNSSTSIAYTEALATDTETLSADTWHHVVCVYDNGEARSYVDGVLQKTNSSYSGLGYKIRGSSGKLRIGARGAGVSTEDRSFNGQIDDVRIYNYSLSFPQILAHNASHYNMTVTDEFSAGQNWTCEVTPNDGRTDGIKKANTTTILLSNQAPITPSVNINSSTYLNTTADILYCFANISDPDGNMLNVSVNWSLNGVFNFSELYTNGTGSYANGSFFNTTLNASLTTKYDNWSCGIQVNDGLLNSNWGWSTNITILNSAPLTPNVIINSSDGSNTTQQDLNCRATIGDIDTDMLNVTVNWSRNGAWNRSTIYNNDSASYLNGSEFVAVLGNLNTTAGENWSCSMQVTDGTANSVWATSLNLTILPGSTTNSCNPLMDTNWIVNSNLFCENTSIITVGTNITETGNLVLSNITLITGNTIIMGNITVRNSKNTIWQNNNLTIYGLYNLTNSTLRINSSAVDGTIGILVNGSGKMDINNNSNITNGNTVAFNYFFKVLNGSYFRMSDSFLAYAGWTDTIWQRGLEVNTSGSRVERSTIHNNYNGLSLYSNYNLVYNNTIKNNNYRGVYVAGGDYNNLSNNTVNSNFNLGFFITSGSDYNTIQNNHVEYTTNPGGTFQLYLYQSVNNTITNNVFKNTTSHVFYLLQSHNTNIQNNEFSYGGENGFYPVGSANITFVNNTLIGNNQGLFFADADLPDQNSYFAKNRIYNSTVNGVFSQSASANVFLIDSIIQGNNYGGGYYDIQYGEPDANNYVVHLLNTTFNKTDGVDFNPTCGSGSNADCKLNVSWYLDVSVNDSVGQIDQANVNITDVNDNPFFNGKTAATGRIITRNITEYIQIFNNTDEIQYVLFNNYTINASKSGYSSNFTRVNITESKTVYITLGNFPPSQNTPIILPSPAYTNNNITCLNLSTSDPEADTVRNVYNWLLNGSSLTQLYYTFDLNTSSGMIKDYGPMGNNITGTQQHFSSGMVGNSYYFGDDSTALSLAEYNYETDYSVVFWENPDNEPNATDGIFNNGDSTIMINHDYGHVNFWRENNNLITSNAVIQNKTWTFVAITVSSNQMNIYINGILDKTENAVTSGINPGFIGAGLSGQYYGYLDEVRIYNRTLTAGQINTLYMEENNSYSNSTIVSEETTKGDNWTCQVIPNDGKQDGILKSNNTIIQNTVPTIPTSIVITPVSIYTNTTMTCTASGSNDIDGDSISYLYLFNETNMILQNWSATNTYNCNNAGCDSGDTIYCWAMASTLDGNGTRSSNSSSILNTMPFTPTVSINSSSINNLTTDTLNCFTTLNDLDANMMNVTVNWSLNGVFNFSELHTNGSGSFANGSFFNTTLNASLTSKSDNWSCSIRLFDGANFSEWGTSSNITILNSEPIMNSSRISPTPTAFTNETLIGYCNATDPDADTIAYYYQWYKNTLGNQSGNTGFVSQAIETNINNISSEMTTYGDNWTLGCRAFDGGSYSDWMNSTTLIINNTKPETPIITINSSNGLNYSNQDLNCFALLNDIDNQSMNVTVNWSRNGQLNISINFTNSGSSYLNASLFIAALGRGNTTRGENWSCSIRLFDGYEYSIWGYSDNLSVVNSPPNQSNPIITPSPATSITNITCNNQSTYDDDQDNVTNIFDWTKNGMTNTILLMPFDTNVSVNASGAVRDYSDYGNNGTLGNGTDGTEPVWNNSGKIGGTYVFDGINDRILIPNSPLLNGNNTWSSMTIEAWVKPSTVSTAKGIVSMRIDTLDSSYNMGFDGSGAGNQLFCGFYLNSSIYSNYTEALAVNTVQLSADEWHHVVCLLNDSTAYSYVDGVLQATNATFAGLGLNVRGSSGKLRIGARGSGISSADRSFNGSIDEVRIYNYSLTLGEILVHNSTGYNIMVTEEYARFDNLSCEVTPNDVFGDGVTLYANTTILEGLTIDLWTNNSYIIFSNNSPVETENVTINVTIFNGGNANAENATIQFFNGDPAINGIQIGLNISVNITANSNITLAINWVAEMGTHFIFVTIDPENSISESNENNNIANKSLTIGSWMLYYGKINSTIYLALIQNMSFTKWFEENITGNLYVTDTDTNNGISWTDLIPIRQNISGINNSNTHNDYDEIDLILGTENNTDSVNTTFTLNNIPRTYENFTVFSANLENVSIDNSTNTSDFVTGILWDSSDSSNAYYDLSEKEDLIFVTKINKNKNGRFGIYDYEIKIPAFLRNYNGTSANVDLYYEIS